MTAENFPWFYDRQSMLRYLDELVDHYVDERILLQKESVQLYEDIQDFWVADDGGRVVGCGALHPLWEDLQARVAELAHLGVCRLDGKAAALEERLFRSALSVYGYAKGYAATHCVQRHKDALSFEEAFRFLGKRVEGLHDPLSWGIEVEKKRRAIESGEW